MADTVAQPPDAEIFDEEALQSITVQNETLPARATNNEPSNTKTSGKTNTTTSAAADGYNTLKELAIDILFCVLCTAIVVLYYLLFDHTLNLSPTATMVYLVALAVAALFITGVGISFVFSKLMSSSK